MMSELLKRTEEALGKDLILEIQKYQYCIVGCGGTGALLAEMLVRAGTKKIVLIDGDRVEESNLNRVISFTKDDIGEMKVRALKNRFEKINPCIKVLIEACVFREHDSSDEAGQKVRDAVCNSDIVLIAVDKNNSRIECEKLCYKDSQKKVLGIGVHVGKKAGYSHYECAWQPKTPPETKDEEGYGNGSYSSIVVEATSVAFSMLLHNLKNPNSNNFKYFFKSYKDFIPEKIILNDNPPLTLRPSSNIS